MLQYALPAGFALFIWWFSTGAIIYLDGLPRRTFRWSMLGATAVLAGALYGVWALRHEVSAAGAYAGFTCGLLIWGWHEMSFLMGFVTGSRRAPCPPGCSGWRRFAYAFETINYHEAAIALTAAALAALSWGGGNQLAMWTFMALWAMRISAKLNIFLGVPNLTEDFLPGHLQFLKSYFRIKPMNLLFPISVTALTAAATLLIAAAAAPDAAAFETAGFMLLATLIALAALEHWFMVLPLQDAALWRWALRSHAANAKAGPEDDRAEPLSVLPGAVPTATKPPLYAS